MTDFPDELRIPLHSLQADVDYLFGRVAADGSCAGAMAASAKERLSQIETAVSAIITELLQARAAKTAGEAKINDAAWAIAVQAEYGRKPIWVYLADCKGNVGICRALLYAYLEALPSTLTNEANGETNA